MVTQHYRWDFVGLSTDTKPTPETSEKVVDGSTFYCSDTSKLYVYCKDNWYERKPLGSGGGGTTYTAGNGITINGTTIEANQIKTLTEDDAEGEYDDGNTITNYVEAWTLPSGVYYKPMGESGDFFVSFYLDDGDPTADCIDGNSIGWFIVKNELTTTSMSILDGSGLQYYIESDTSTGELIDSQYLNQEFVGTDGTYDGTAGLVPAPSTTDAGKFLKADGTWDVAGGGGGDTVYSSVTTSNTSNGGAVYIGNLNSSQVEQTDPTSTDNHYKYFWALPLSNGEKPANNSVNILGNQDQKIEAVSILGKSYNDGGVSIGYGGQANTNSVSIGYGAIANGNRSVAIGSGSNVASHNNSVAIGRGSVCTRQGEFNIGASGGYGYDSSNLRVLSGVHDPVQSQDAATKAYVDNRTFDLSQIDNLSNAFNNPGIPQSMTTTEYANLVDAVVKRKTIGYWVVSGANIDNQIMVSVSCVGTNNDNYNRVDMYTFDEIQILAVWNNGSPTIEINQ